MYFGTSWTGSVRDSTDVYYPYDKIHDDEIFLVEGKPFIKLNDAPMPLILLGPFLDSPTPYTETNELRSVVVLQALDRIIAIEVDEFLNETELVLKPLSRELGTPSYIAGGAIMGTGKVIIVLDANELVHQISGLKMPNTATRKPIFLKSNIDNIPLRILVVDDSITTRT